MNLSYRTPIWYYPIPVDFRKQIDGLVILISDQINQQPTSGELFVFRNRGGDKIKLLWYDDNGFWLCYKRIEKAKLKFPTGRIDTLTLSRDELSWLLSGLDFTKQKALPNVTATKFF